MSAQSHFLMELWLKASPEWVNFPCSDSVRSYRYYSICENSAWMTFLVPDSSKEIKYTTDLKPIVLKTTRVKIAPIKQTNKLQE